MLYSTIIIVTAIITVIFLEYLLNTWIKRKLVEKKYNIDKIFSKKNKIIRIFIPIILSLTFTFFVNDIRLWEYGSSLSALVWLMLLASCTDITDLRIPKEACWLTISVIVFYGLTFYLSGFLFPPHHTASLFSFLAAIITTTIITLFLALITRGGFGSGDVRLILAFSTLGWWTGYSTILVGLILASLIQTIIMFIVWYKNRMKKKTKTILPFAPALSIGFLLSIALLVSSSTVCLNWASTLSC